MLTTLTLGCLILTADPTITAYAGTGERGYSGDGGPATKAKLDNPFHPAFDSNGNLFFSDTFNHVIRRVDAKTGIITTVAGSGKKGYTGDGGPATKATMNEPYGIAFDADDNLYIVDRLNACIRKVETKTQTITTFAGTGTAGYSGDGKKATQAQLREPNSIIPYAGGFLIADVKDHRIRYVLSNNLVTTFGGNGQGKTEGDGKGILDATFHGPRAIAKVALPDGAVMIVEREGNCVRMFDNKGFVQRYAGTGQKGYTGDGGPALKATFNGPKEICGDKDGNVFVVDTENDAIRRIDAKTGIITTVAGKGKTKTPGLGDGGPATQATLGRPHGVAVSPDGALYIADTLSHKIRVVK